MMKFLHGLFEFLVFLVVLLEGTLMIYGMTNAGQCYWNAVMNILMHEKLIVFMSGVALILLVILYLLTTGRKVRQAQTISFSGHNGPVSISMKAVRDFVQRTGDEFSEILSLQPNLDFKGGSLVIDLDVRVVSGAHVPELCQMLQERVTDCIHDQLGLKDVKAVRINVRELVQRPGKSVTETDVSEIS
jgi:uncharacterized alkaline shock family protein YloU